MEPLQMATAALAVVNVALALVLAVVYGRNHREIKSPFTLGLLLFSLFLVVHGAAVVYDYATMMTMYSGTLESLRLAQEIVQTAAVGALLVATLR